MQLQDIYCFNSLLLMIVYCTVKGNEDFPGPNNVQVSLEFVKDVPYIFVTWDPPVISEADNGSVEILSYEVSIFQHTNGSSNDQQPLNISTLSNQTTFWNISNSIKTLATYHVSLKVNYTGGCSETVNTSSIDVRYLQNFAIYSRENNLRAKCHLAKSDDVVDCQLVVLTVKEDINEVVLSPVNIMQSNFSMLLPSDEDKLLVIARAVGRHGASAEMFNITHTIATLPKSKPTATTTSIYINPSNPGTEMCRKDNSVTPVVIWLVIITLLITLIILISLIIIVVYKASHSTKKAPLRKKTCTVNTTDVSPESVSNMTSSASIQQQSDYDSLLPSKNAVNPNVSPVHDSNMTSSTLIPQQSDYDSLVMNSTPLPLLHKEAPKEKSYENIPSHQKPLAIRHSHIEMKECPAYKVIKCNSGDYDDVCPTVVTMQPNPSYKHYNI